MASSGSEGVPYDDDFEEASDEDKSKSLHGEGSRREIHSASRRRKVEDEVFSAPLPPPDAPPAEAKPGVLGESRRPGRRRSEEEREPGRREPGRPGDGRPPVAARSATEEVLEMNTSGGSFAGTGRRPVRAKISVGGGNIESEPSDRRPGTGQSVDSTSKSSAARPIWLQSSEPLARQASPNQGLRASSGPRSLSGDRSLGLGAGAYGGSAPPRSADPCFLSGGRGRPPIDPDFDADAGLGTGDAERKVKRLQQEVQRLSGRLKEAELYSGADEGLPLFTFDEVEVGCQIGQGGFCSVHHGVWRSTPCAIKKIFDPVLTDELKAEFENEVKSLRRLRHPNIIIIMAVCRVPPALSILTEFVGGGSMFELLHGPPSAKRRDSIDCEPASLLPVMHQTAAALAYLHAMLVVHRDVKSHNLLLTPGRVPVAKLCDFGLARQKSELCTGTMQWAGTACYMAPELFAKRRYTEAVDVFAFGVMLWEAMSTEIPHANLDPADIYHRVQSKDGAGLPVTHAWPKSLKALLKTSLAVQAEDRPSMVSVSEQIQHIILEFPPPDE